MTLTEALELTPADIVAVVGGGGKTSVMFRLAKEMVDQGASAITTTTTRIFAAQIALAPAHVAAGEASRARLTAALAAHRHVLVIGATDTRTGKADGVSLDLFERLRAWCPGVCILNEADGSRMRPFKAPAEHEPVIPESTTLVVPVVGADIFGQPLDARHVHRPELVSALGAVPLGAPITPALVAGVLAHSRGGCKAVPVRARVIVVINKLDTLKDPTPAHETAERLLQEPHIQAVVLTTLRAAEPVVRVLAR